MAVGRWDDRELKDAAVIPNVSGNELPDRARVGAGELASRVGLEAADARDPLDLARACSLLVRVGERHDGLLVCREVSLACLPARGEGLLVQVRDALGGGFDGLGDRVRLRLRCHDRLPWLR